MSGTSGGVRRFRSAAGLAGGAAVAAAILGVGTAHAAPSDDVAGTAVTTAAATSSGWDGSWLFGDLTNPGDAAATTNSSVDLLSTAYTNLTDASDLLSGLGNNISSIGDRLDTIAQTLPDKIEPAESAILAHSGSLSGLVDQLFLDPLNQQWLATSDAVLSASQALESATADGSNLEILTATLQLNGAVWFQLIPTAFASVPVGIVGSFFGDAAGDAAAVTPDLFDLPF